MALWYFTRISTCLTMMEAFADASYDCLTRMLHGTWSGHTLLDLALRTLFMVTEGYLALQPQTPGICLKRVGQSPGMALYPAWGKVGTPVFLSKPGGPLPVRGGESGRCTDSAMLS